VLEMPEGSELGFITVSDGTLLKFKLSIVDIKEIEGLSLHLVVLFLM
jgi:hypothetical protein